MEDRTRAGTAAGMPSGQILDLFRMWNQRDLLMDKVWGEREREAFYCSQTYVLEEKNRDAGT